MKNILKTSFALLAISTLGCATASEKSQEFKGRVIEFKSDSSGFDTKTYFYEGKYEVIAIDAQFTPALAEQSLHHLRKFTDKPISWLIITHPNPDKFNGASVFKKLGTRILASQKTANAIPEVHKYKEFYFVEIAKMFKKEQYPQPVPIDHTFTRTLDLVLRGGEKISLRELSEPGVSSTQTVVHVPSIRSLFVGDLIHYKAHAWLEGGIINGQPKPTIVGWKKDLEELSAHYPHTTTIYAGRGKSTDLHTAIQEQTDYLTKSVSLIRKELNSLGTKAAEFNGPNSGVMYKSLSARFQSAFPDYELGYLIEYGSYGLVQSELKK